MQSHGCIFSTVHADYEYLAESETGDIVEDAVYARNRAVEELLDIEFHFTGLSLLFMNISITKRIFLLISILSKH